MARERLRIALKRKPAMTVSRIAIDDYKLVYVLCANKPFHYQNGSSPIVYIGTTSNGIDRFAQSAAGKAEQVFRYNGVTSIDIKIVTCTPRRNVKTWHKLERAMLIVFNEMFGSAPQLNGSGHGMTETDEFELFARSRVESILASLTENGLARGAEISN